MDWCAADWPDLKFLLTLKHESGGLLLRSRDGGTVFTPENTGASVPLARVIDAFGTFVALGGASPVEIRITASTRWTAAEVPSLAGGLSGATAVMTPAAPFVTIAVGQSQNRALIIGPYKTSLNGC